MTNEEILNKRWEVTDNTLKDYLKKFTSLKNSTLDDIIEIFDSLNITYSDLNKNISSSEKRRLNKKIDNWKEQGLLTGYFEYLVNSKGGEYTYSDLIEILLYGAYSSQQKEIDELSRVVFTTVAEDVYNQALNEITIKPKKKFSLTWEYIWSLLWIPTVNKSWDDYLKILTLTNVQETQKKALSIIQQNRSVTENDLKDLLQKQMNRIINISSDEDGDKYSGILNDTSRMLGNEIYTKPFADEEEKIMVRFIAEIDKRTTKMCRSMSNELFYVNDINKFTRYSEYSGGIVDYEVYGLQVGVNLPPITDHFHWCRSTITYNLDTSIPDIIRAGLNIANEADKEQFERYKKYFGDEVPDNVEDFTRMKLNDTETWEDLKSRYYEARRNYKNNNTA